MLKFWEELFQNDEGNVHCERSDERRRVGENVNYANEEYAKHMEEHNYSRNYKVWREDGNLRREEVEKAMKDGKVPGLTGLKAEMWRAMLELLGPNELTRCFQKVMDEEIPELEEM